MISLSLNTILFYEVLFAFFGVFFLATSCTPEFVPQSLLEEDPNAIISPTLDPNGRTGEVEASFLSSEHSFTVTNSIMPNDTVLGYLMSPLLKTLMSLNGCLKGEQPV